MCALVEQQPPKRVTSADIADKLLEMHIEQLERGNEQARNELLEAKRRASA